MLNKLTKNNSYYINELDMFKYLLNLDRKKLIFV